MDKDRANLLLRLAWSIALGRVKMPRSQALAHLRHIHNQLSNSRFWWQRKRVEKVIRYYKKRHNIPP